MQISCPHCGATGNVKTPRSQCVSVMPCPQCDRWLLLFQKKVVAVNRRIIQEGSFEERKEHLTGLLATLLPFGNPPEL